VTTPTDPFPVVLGAQGLTPAEVVAVARQGAPVSIGADAIAAMEASRRWVEGLAASPEPTYGVSTGFGAMATRHIAPADRLRLQASLVRSHAAGVGPPVEREVVRAMLLLRARTLAMGHSGVRPVVAERLVALLNAGITPVVPEHGSLGCSGDLAPLAHAALVLIGEGAVLDDRGDPVAAGPVLAAAGIEPITLLEKEGLALVNGTDGMLGLLVLACADLRAVLQAADVVAALSVDALLGTDRAFAAELLALRPHPGQAASAANLVALLAGSALLASHRTGDARVQDAYSLRCTPQVHGAARDALAYAEEVAARELRSAIDNPVVLDVGRVASNGNFHGAPLAHACDFLAIVAADVGSIAERRIDRLLDRNRSNGLPPFLADDPGVDSGLMIAHYTAAALVAEAKRLAVPASTDSMPTSALQEDHVSMGWAAARKLRVAVADLARIVAIEAVTAARAVELRAPLRTSAPLEAAVRLLRTVVPGPGPDRHLAPELEAAAAVVSSGALAAAAATELEGGLR
jgi:histidine ammonia-lyase